MSNHLEIAAWRSLNDQQMRDFPELSTGYDIVPLLEEVLEDSRIADSRLDLKAYFKLLGPDKVAVLLARHRHEEKK